MWVRLAPGAQQVGGQGVAGLMRHPPAEVEFVDPALEPAVEPLVGQRHAGRRGCGRLVGNSAIRARSASVGAATVVGDEASMVLRCRSARTLVEPFGDADRGVVVADLGLVVPEHRQPAVAAQAVPAELEHLADAAAGDDGGLPHVAQAAVVRVVPRASRRRLASSASARATSSGNGRRGTRPVVAPGGGHGDDELPGQADAGRRPRSPARRAAACGCVEHDRAGDRR